VTRVVVADDQDLVRAGFSLILERNGVEVVGEARDGVEAVAVVADTRPDVVLMDIRMPRLDGIEATRRITSQLPGCRVLVLTTFDLDEYVYAAVRAGASGFLLKDVPPPDLVHAVSVVERGESMLSPTLTKRLLERFATGAPVVAEGVPAPFAGLSERELDLVRLVAAGLSNAEIGERLFLGTGTVKTYISRILTSLDRRDRVQLAVLAYETGLVRPGATPTP
jgi:DNA-binding NarL/FixJ family response regulator